MILSRYIRIRKRILEILGREVLPKVKMSIKEE